MSKKLVIEQHTITPSLPLMENEVKEDMEIELIEVKEDVEIEVKEDVEIEVKEYSQTAGMGIFRQYLRRRSRNKRMEATNEELLTEQKKEESEPFWTRCRKIYSFIPKLSCFLILGVLVGESIVENAVANTLMTYLTDVRMDKLTTAALTVNWLQVISGLLSIPATYFKLHTGCYSLIIISSLSYSTGLWLMCISASSRTKLCHAIFSHEDWCHKMENPLFYVGIVLAGLGKAGFISSCVKDFLEHQVEAKLNEQGEEGIIALAIQTKLNNAKNKYEREAIRDDENRRISIDDMTREDKTRIAVLILSNNFRVFGVIFGSLMYWFLRSWPIRFQISIQVLYFTLGLFLMGRYLFASYVYNTRSTVVSKTDDPHPIQNLSGNDNDSNVILKGPVTTGKTLLLRLFPVYSTFIMYGVVKSTGKSFFIEQAKNVDRSLGPIHKVPLPILLITGNVFGMYVNSAVRLYFYRRLRVDRRIHGILIRIGLGLLCSLICCGTARWSENERLRVVREKGLLDNHTDIVPLTFWYLVPQFLSYGAMKHLAATGLRMFFKYELPESMEEYASGLADTVIGIGAFFGVIAVPITQKLSEKYGGTTGWFADTINRSHLDYFYNTLSIFCLLNLALYAYVSTRYIRKRNLPNKEGQEGPNEEEVFEEAA